MKIALLYYRLFDDDGKEQLIGGIETYLLNLAELCKENNWDPILFQSSHRSFRKEINSLNVIGVPIAGVKQRRQKNDLFQAAISYVDMKKDIIIFGADHCSIRTDNRRCIAIQHGIEWDKPAKHMANKRFFQEGVGAWLYKERVKSIWIKFFENCYNRVCVDYNFLNWYRATKATEPKGKIWIIPNFASFIGSLEQITDRDQSNNTVRILFARRFEHYRGVRIMAEAVKDILRCYDQVRFTFAGEGAEEEWLRKQFANETRVSFIKYLPHDTLDIHLAHDIAVVPSIASEGTSLSVAEAMGAGCAVVATAVGGITNMIIDGFNGILVMADTQSLLAGIKSVIDNPVLRRELGRRAHETAMHSFALDIWRKKWSQVIEEVARG